MSAPLPPRGRGTASNPLNRFAPTHSEAFDDGWEQDVPPIQLTEVREEIARTVISRNQSPDLPFDRSINPYRGCEHGWLCCVNGAAFLYLEYFVRIMALGQYANIRNRYA